ncbi:MAG: glucose-6-phosphate isomerase [Vicinamibacterales bacterium]
MKNYYPAAVDAADTLIHQQVIRRIWDRDVSAWGAAAGSADAKSIQTRLGWLDVAHTTASELGRVNAFATAVKADGIRSVYLLGMGGSSLCAEVMASVFGVGKDYPRLVVLDTTDERTITTAAQQSPARETLFIVASKSGSTVEVASMERFFWARMAAALGGDAGRHFIAITDPGTALQRLAESRGYREIFVNPPDIGGRFSALSLFGLVPAALIGTPVNRLAGAGKVTADGCRQENHTNPGLELGAFIGAAIRERRDKLTIALSPRLASLGLWIEQLIAESTGKHGTGALPVVDEPLGTPDDYGNDRAFVALATEVDEPDPHKLRALELAGHPLLRLTTRIDDLGSEFFRWEFATAVAGAVLQINPFDEPNVAEAKEKTKSLLASYAANGHLPQPDAAAENDAVAVFSKRFSGGSPADVVRAAIGSVTRGDYVVFLSYLPGDSGAQSVIANIRVAIRARTHAASTFGIGPRYLHSTGQFHKGGPNTALAFVITADDETNTAIPESGYTFSVLKRAQALGDAETLEAHDRRTVRIHIKNANAAARTLDDLFEEAMK